MPWKPRLTKAEFDALKKPEQQAYRPEGDGFIVDLEGGYVDPVRHAEFRDSNRSLNALKTELETKLAALQADRDALAQKVAAFDGIDVVKAREALAKPDVSNKLAETEAALAAAQVARQEDAFKTAIGWEAMKLGVRPETLDWLVAEAKKTFRPTATGVETEVFSPTTPGTKLSIGEWTAQQVHTAAWAFLPSKGGGATKPAGGAGTPPRGRVNLRDPLDVGRNLEAVAAGTVDFDR